MIVFKFIKMLYQAKSHSFKATIEALEKGVKYVQTKP